MGHPDHLELVKTLGMRRAAEEAPVAVLPRNQQYVMAPGIYIDANY
jgi:hypothetical protein